MKARKRNSNDEWQEVEYVQLKNSYVITKADQMEFDTPHGKEQTKDEWKDVRERAAIAAMQGLLANSALFYNNGDLKIGVIDKAIEYSNKLIEELKKNNENN